MSDNQDAATAAARILVARRRHGQPGPRLPESCRPADFDAALAIQAAVTDQLGDRIGGWKCGLPSPDRLVVAPIYARTLCADSPCAVWAEEAGVQIEPELAFVFGADLPARAEPYTPAEVDVAIAHTHLALELIGQRFLAPAEIGFPEMLADGLVNQGLYLGPTVDAAQARAASEFPIWIVRADGTLTEYAGRHPAGAPCAPLYWLVEFLRERGQGIEAGQVVITGSYAGTLTVPVGEAVQVTYGELGALTVRFAPLGGAE